MNGFNPSIIHPRALLTMMQQTSESRFRTTCNKPVIQHNTTSPYTEETMIQSSAPVSDEEETRNTSGCNPTCGINIPTSPCNDTSGCNPAYSEIIEPENNEESSFEIHLTFSTSDADEDNALSDRLMRSITSPCNDTSRQRLARPCNDTPECNVQDCSSLSLIEELLDFNTTLKSIQEWFEAESSKMLVLEGDENYALAITITNRWKARKTRCSLSDWNWKHIIRFNCLNVIDERVSSNIDLSELIEVWKDAPTLKFIILPSSHVKARFDENFVIASLTSFGESKRWDWYQWCKEMEEHSLITIRYWTVEESLKNRHIRDTILKSRSSKDDNL